MKDGLTVDFLGMTDADKPGAPWWSTSGALLPKPIYDTAAYRAESHAFGGNTKNVIFTFRLPAASEGATVAYKVSGALGSSSEGGWLSKMQGQEHQTEAQAHPRTGGGRVLTAAFPSSLTKTSIQISIASGPWKTAATDTHDTLGESAGFMSAGSHGNSKFIFSPVSVSLSSAGGVVLSVSTDATDDLRVVAVTTQGQTVLPDEIGGPLKIGGNGIGTLDKITARFSLPLTQIKEFRVETRPFRWVEFKDVALQPLK